MNASSVLNVHGLTKIFPPQRSGGLPFVAVDNVSFDLKKGEILGLLGPNGAGKTTTMHMLLSTLKPTSGSINYFGKDFITHRSECLQSVGFASTYINFPKDLTVEENFYIYGTLYGLKKDLLYERINYFLSLFNIEHLRTKKVATLSAGQKTRIMLSKAFLANPKVVLLDEPTASLDPDIAHDVREFVLQQKRDRGTAIFFASHNMDEVAYVCDRVLVLAHGKIIACDTPHNLASSVDICRVKFVVSNEIDRIRAFALEHNLEYQVIEHTIEIKIDEHNIANLLTGLAQAGISYAQIAIEKPTLEDYFIYIARTSQQEAMRNKQGAR